MMQTLKQALASVLMVAATSSIAATATTAQDRTRRIRFVPGRTTAIIRGALLARGDESHIYLLRARAGQTITAHITASGRGDAAFSIRTPDGEIIDEDRSIEIDWSGELPQTGDYRITVFNPARVRGFTRYTLEVTVR